jgi:hypothetical protein
MLSLLSTVLLPTSFQRLQSINIQKTTDTKGSPRRRIKQGLIEVVPHKEAKLLELKDHGTN